MDQFNGDSSMSRFTRAFCSSFDSNFSRSKRSAISKERLPTSAFNSAMAALRSIAMASLAAATSLSGSFTCCVFGIGYQLVSHFSGFTQHAVAFRCGLPSVGFHCSRPALPFPCGPFLPHSRRPQWILRDHSAQTRIGPHAKRRSMKSTTRNAMDAQTTVPKAGVSSAPIVYYPRATSKQMMMPKRATPSTSAAATIMLERKSLVASG